MTEGEWKILRTVKAAALDRLCGAILDESRTALDGEGSNHERFLRLFEVVHERNKDVAWGFDGLTRSHADQKLAIMYRMGLVTDEELAMFQPNTQEFVRLLVSIDR